MTLLSAGNAREMGEGQGREPPFLLVTETMVAQAVLTQ